jgi:hypothetical protein
MVTNFGVPDRHESSLIWFIRFRIGNTVQNSDQEAMKAAKIKPVFSLRKMEILRKKKEVCGNFTLIVMGKPGPGFASGS